MDQHVPPDVTSSSKRGILIVDDSEVVRRSLRASVEAMAVFGRVVQATDGHEAIRALETEDFDVVLCDILMPRLDGYKLLAWIRSHARLADLPVILLTGNETVEDKIHGLELGASDYLTKPCDLGELMARIKVQLKIKELQDKLKQAAEALRLQSITDALTGLFNRRHFEAELAKELARARRYKTELALCILDIDHFKRVNDGFGHPAGDAVLVSIAAIVRQAVRVCDLVARFGGEELVIILPQTPLSGALTALERIRALIAGHAHAALRGQHVTASFGVVVFPGAEVDTAEQLLACADAALYRAKQNGRDRVESAGALLVDQSRGRGSVTQKTLP